MSGPTRIDMSTGDWHRLIGPVLLHAPSGDEDLPTLAQVRIEVTSRAVFAVATDRHTLAAERRYLEAQQWTDDPPPPIGIERDQAAASLRLFTYSKDHDPALRITIDTVPIPVEIVGTPTTVNRWGITIQAEDGTRLVIHDKRDPAADPLAGWRRTLARAVHRETLTTTAAFAVNPDQLARWKQAARKGEHLAFYTGAEDGDLILVLAGEHFAGVWQPIRGLLDPPPVALAESPWPAETAGAVTPA